MKPIVRGVSKGKDSKEDRLIKQIGTLIKKEMTANKTVPFDEAFMRVINRHPDIRRDIEGLERELLREKTRREVTSKISQPGDGI